MTNNHNHHHGDPKPHWWPHLADRINTWWINHEPLAPALRDIATTTPPRALAAILTATTAVLAAAVVLLWWLISGLIGVATGTAHAIRGAADTGAHTITASSLARTITDPVGAYLDTHSAGLPVTANTLHLTWLATTGVLLLLAALGSRGARIGWTLTGATTTAMVYAGTTHTARPVAAGLALTTWALLSVIAFNRLATRDTPTPPLSLTALRPQRQHHDD